MSFIGGGTDLPMFYERQQGAVISTAIDKYVYVTVNKRFDSSIRVSYSQTEIVDTVNELRHTRCREAMRVTGVDSGIEITSVADVPAGTGLGSSSSFTVGLFNALYAYRGVSLTTEGLAEQACDTEVNTLKEPIGKQDQYAAAYGGLRHYVFNSDGTVYVDPVPCTRKRRAAFFDHLMLFYMGGTRDASSILKQANNNAGQLNGMRGLVDDFWQILTRGDLRGLGDILHAGWENKKLMGAVTNAVIDETYSAARASGALGGKLLGAGQSGFLMLLCDPKDKDRVRAGLARTLKNPREIPFGYEPEGSKIVYHGR